jgi:hypothetical protein
VAHSQLNGLMRTLISDGAGSVQINATAKDTALELLAGPLAASTLVAFMVPWLGWDATALNASIPAMFDLWGRIAGAPYPGDDPPEQLIAAVTGIRGGNVTLAEAADAFLSSPRVDSPNTHRAYASVLDHLAAEIGPGRPTGRSISERGPATTALKPESGR